MELGDVAREALGHRAQLLSRISELRRELDEAREELRLCIGMIDGLRRAAFQFGDSDVLAEFDAAEQQPEQLEWGSLTRTAAMLRVMNEVDHPMSPAAISEALVAKGREGDTPRLVSALLSALSASGRVKSQGRAAWRVSASPQLIDNVEVG